MEELNDFSTLISRVVVMELEFSAFLDPIAKLPNPLSKAPLVGRGIRHAFGFRSGFSIMGPCGDETKNFREHHGAEAFDTLMADAMVSMERSILRGPVDGDDQSALRGLGYNPERPAAVAESRAEQEREFKKNSTPTRSRDVDVYTIAFPLASSSLNFKIYAQELSRSADWS